MEPTIPLQVAVQAALRESAALTAIVGVKVYDRVPEGTVAPYVTYSGWQEIEDGSDCADSAEVFFDVQCFSDIPSRAQVAAMSGAVRAALHRLAPQATGLGNVEILHNTTQYFREDGLTQRAVVNFKALVDSAS